MRGGVARVGSSPSVCRDAVSVRCEIILLSVCTVVERLLAISFAFALPLKNKIEQKQMCLQMSVDNFLPIQLHELNKCINLSKIDKS